MKDSSASHTSLLLLLLPVLAAAGQIACGSVDPVAEGGSASPGTVAATSATAAPETPGRRQRTVVVQVQDIPSGEDMHAQSFAVGGSHACKLTNGNVQCWGYNYYGQLGLGDDVNRGDKDSDMGAALGHVNLGAHKATAVAAGESHTCAILEDGRVTCWGENGHGQLGRGDAVASWGTDPSHLGDGLVTVDLGASMTAKALALGTRHSCAILNDDSIKCWGDNSDGQLGTGDAMSRGTSATGVGGTLLRVQLGTGKTARALSAGGLHTCAILNDFTLKCWGANQEGQLGYGDTTSRGKSSAHMGDALAAVPLGTDVTAVLQLAASTYGTCAILGTATTTLLKCWGDNFLGQLGTGDTQNRGDTLATIGDGLPAISLGAGATPVLVAAGWDHTCATLTDHTTKCWGANSVGQLGLGDTDDRGARPNEMGDALPAVSLGGASSVLQLFGGIAHTCALLDTDSVKCWGYNALGQLGQNSIRDLGDEPGEMGSALPIIDLGR